MDGCIAKIAVRIEIRQNCMPVQMIVVVADECIATVAVRIGFGQNSRIVPVDTVIANECINAF